MMKEFGSGCGTSNVRAPLTGKYAPIMPVFILSHVFNAIGRFLIFLSFIRQGSIIVHSNNFSKCYVDHRHPQDLKVRIGYVTDHNVGSQRGHYRPLVGATATISTIYVKRERELIFHLLLINNRQTYRIGIIN